MYKKFIKYSLILIFVLSSLLVFSMFLLEEDNFNENEISNNTDLQVISSRPQGIASSHELATKAGFEILDNGGTAADAAVAVAAVLSVVEPWFSSVLGGGSWALYYNAETGEITSQDGVGTTGSLATAADYATRAGIPGMHQAIVPGAWDGWMLWLMEYGNLGLDEILAPAIRIAREGYPMSAEMSVWLERQKDQTRNRPETEAIYFVDGESLKEGDTVFQLDMADTFESLVDVYLESGQTDRIAGLQAARDYFYRGPIAEAIVAFSEAGAGYLTLQDFANFEAEIVEPISIQYNDEITVFQNPPNSQGITMLMALNILKDYDWSELDINDPLSVHLQTEAMKLAFSDRYYHVGDPRRVPVPVAQLLSDTHANNQRGRINMQQAMEWPIADGLMDPLDPDAGYTTTFHVVDQYGNGAAVTTSLGAQFFVIGDTGIHINHRMRFLALDDGNPNQVAAGYKVRHTSNPYIALKNNTLHILGGNTGADTQSQGQVQQFINVIEFGLTPQEAVARPRFLTTAFPSTVYSYQVRNNLQLENGTPQSLIDGLRNLGHNIVVGEGTWGSANMIVLNEDGTDLETGTDPRIGVSYGYKKFE